MKQMNVFIQLLALEAQALHTIVPVTQAVAQVQVVLVRLMHHVSGFNQDQAVIASLFVGVQVLMVLVLGI